MAHPYFCTETGILYVGDALSLLADSSVRRSYKGTCDLIFFSPPYSLVRQKSYRNKTEEDYVTWLESFANPLASMLAPTGSIVIEIGNAWNQGSPTVSTAPLEALLAFKRAAKLHLCQEFIWHNPARLPSPAQWVTIERIRVKDSFTRVWWMSKTERPKADNRRVLQPYSRSMKKLLRKQRYNAGRRPSEHTISEASFLTDNGGAIPPAAMTDLPEDFITLSNTRNETTYKAYCKARGLPEHPARMPAELAKFFLSFLTDPSDLVFDPFAGSNTTGWVAEEMGRRWLSFELSQPYAEGSKGRFLLDEVPESLQNSDAA